MKITEIDFNNEDKEYEAVICGYKTKVRVEKGDLLFLEEGKWKDVSEEVLLSRIVGMDFTEVVEPPVDFITAYMDCKENGHMYTRDSDNYTIKAIMSRFDSNVVFDFVGDSVGAFFPDKTMWIKVV